MTRIREEEDCTSVQHVSENWGCVSVINRCSVSLVDKAEHRHEYHCLYVVDEEDCGAADVYNGLWRDSALLPAGGGQLAALLVGPSYRHNPR